MLTNEEVDELLNHQYDKEKKTSLLLDKLQEELKHIPNDDSNRAMEFLIKTLQSMVKWVPVKFSHPIYTMVLPNKLRRLNSQAQRIALLEQFRDRLLSNIDKDHDGLLL